MTEAHRRRRLGSARAGVPPDGRDEASPLCASSLEDEIVELPITSVFDLHTVPPRDVTGVVEAYLEAAWEKGLTELRIIHGKGIGVQREAVRKVLERSAFVESFRTAPEDAGGWGATLVTLRPVKLKER